MRCPICKKGDKFNLVETADDYQDGYIECSNCGEMVATYNWTVIVPELDQNQEED